MIEKDRYITIFADASYCDRTGCYGWAVWIKYGHPPEVVRFFGGGRYTARNADKEWRIQSSDDAEKFALDTAVRALKYYKIPYRGKIVVIQSDCERALQEVKTRPIRKHVREIRFKHVKGHRGFATPRSSVNTWCDRAARKKMRRLREQLRGK